MREHRAEHLDSPGARLLRWAERLLLAAGGAMLGWCVLNVADAAVSQWTARRSLEAAAPLVGPAQLAAPAPTSGVLPRSSPIRGTAVAALSIPRVRLSAVVLHGSDTQTLRRGPGHLENTALPGESGNVVIAGHRDSFFRALRDIAPEDDIFLDTAVGRFHYRVSSLRVISAHDVSVIKPTPAPVLTLITCYPFSLIGPAPDRFMVRANQVDERPAASPAVTNDWMAAPIIHPPTAGKPSEVARGAGSADEALVRQAVERFRLTYNARLLRRGETTARDALKFEHCDVVIDADSATAICNASSRLPGEPDLRLWTLTLQRDGGEWAIRMITTD
jgi:sortase A